MKTLIQDIKTVRKDLYFLLAISIILIILIDFVFNDGYEIFKRSRKLGIIIENLSLSIIAGFIFYFLTVHLKTENDKRNYNEKIGRLTFDIITETHNLTVTILSNDKKNNDWNFNDSLYNACSNIHTLDKGVITWSDGTEGNWLEFLHNYSENIKKNIKSLTDRLQYLESRHSTLIGRIEDSPFLSQISFAVQMIHSKQNFIKYGMDNLSFLSIQLKLHLQLVKDLEDYANKELIYYKKITMIMSKV